MHPAFHRRDLFRGDRFRRFYLGIKSLVERILDFHSHVTQHIHDRLQIDQRQAVLIYQIRTVGPHIQKPHATVPVQQKSQFFILAIHIGQQHPVRKLRLIPISQFPDRYRFVYRKFFVRRTDLRLQFDFHNPSSFDFSRYVTVIILCTPIRYNRRIFAIASPGTRPTKKGACMLAPSFGYNNGF